ncbi:MAG TPA: SDR family NAD(P)-dependent oxidoreductase, partial [Nitrospirales bacterium]|nr:SDR family NAD(P)-dependent oxidoreductase [Nitrospirales bacterium]
MTPAPLTKKVFIITGASGGLGQAVVPAFAKAGARTVTIDRHPPAQPASEHLAFAADVTDAADVKRVVAEVLAKTGTVDGLI